MLLLAGMDRLDTELTVGQMQGKFQLTVLPQAGHAVHEDQPRKGTPDNTYKSLNMPLVVRNRVLSLKTFKA